MEGQRAQQGERAASTLGAWEPNLCSYFSAYLIDQLLGSFKIIESGLENTYQAKY